MAEAVILNKFNELKETLIKLNPNYEHIIKGLTFRICDYEIIKSLGSGAYGSVKIAKDKQGGRKFALKNFGAIRFDENKISIIREMCYFNKCADHVNVLKLHEICVACKISF